MMNNKIALLTAASALAQQVTALSAHRHMHQVLEKRALDAEARVAELEARGVVVETEWVVVTETIHWTAGMEAPPAPTEDAVAEVAAAPQPAPAPAAPTTLAKVPVAEKAPAPVVAAPVAEESVPETEAPKKEKAKVETPKASTGSKKEKTNTDSGSTGGAPFSSKRGLAYNIASLANTFGSSCEVCSWGYNWASRRDDLDDKYGFVPMLWGNSDEWTSDWAKNAKEMIAQGSKALFSFNEPDIASQANLTPGQAAADYVTHMNPFAGKALLGAPSVSNSGEANQGLDWLQQFMDTCTDCKIDFCNVHWYSEPEYADTLFEHIEKAHRICNNKPIWLTEFAPLGTGEAVDNFVKTVIPKLDQIEYLDAYSYFMVDQSHLMSGDADLSSYGKIYASVA